MKTLLEDTILASLNNKQCQAVTSPSSGVLQIIAGPGTGKTKVIVSRVAYLLLHERISPQNIIVTTFTKKAANEMVERLRELFCGSEIPFEKLLIGTFHSICYKIIQKYGHLIGLTNISIADEKDSMQILSNALTSKITTDQWKSIDALSSAVTGKFKTKNEAKGKFNGYDPKAFKRHISKAKSAGLTPEDYDKQHQKNALLLVVYQAYQNELLANKVLDFDDCLLYCFKIVSCFPVLRHVEHTLVDEFQDTNEIQLQLMYCFAKGASLHSNVTIVGDPDQSIYAFRDAQAVNFEKMRDHYLKTSDQPCKIITLDENYRSTSDILHISETIMRQQPGRVVKNLTSQLEKSFKPFHAVLDSSEEEARWITHQAEFLAGLPQGIFSYSDMAILVRSAFQTRLIENELTRKKIPYFMVRGKAFWERKEVVAILDYLRCVTNKDDKLAFIRCVNFPKRGLGPKALADLDSLIDGERMRKPNHSVFLTLQRIATADLKSSLGPKMRDSLFLFLRIIEDTHQILLKGFEIGAGDEKAVIEEAFNSIYKNSNILKEFEEKVDIELNIEEVKAQLLAFELPPEFPLPDLAEAEIQNVDEITGPLFIRKFLELISLYDTDPGKSEEQLKKPKISISTIHGSKGLEWPVVFVPGASEGLLPASFAIDEAIPETVNEERRCLYVATSRAQTLLYISAYTETESGGWRKPVEECSRFMKKAGKHCATHLELDTQEKLKTLFELRGSELTAHGFDVEAYHEEYTRGLLEYVKKQTFRSGAHGEFTSAGKLNYTPRENTFIQKPGMFPRKIGQAKSTFLYPGSK
ncbi:UvrD-helicase-domain-containing protein [Metschnikowia bicuspidata var. bicuspidata NRRL YB-4993]|uniref:DNA 3'-5' helicase n=1 Tax=Metschnikowia bicuspidata var. bicuspidata NRRL YB-4993 TaxID=869754 RepID=A0A1A0HK43_9ASCO|nr:UvrD-helicase-domain-containing protein [Metschnikowia bicuspidata var. bicuspidata NRRL YB-4993]OBA24257.1 UvrD-helicase-domain-containing protein [Metschnikowia bicuspidata var. bicuspidata NRRL YB-4993]